MTKGKIKVRFKRSYLYTFGSHWLNVKNKPHPLQGPDFSRIVYCNQPHVQDEYTQSYRDNSISTTKYNVITFLPTALFEQFRRVANLYFLLAACLSLTPMSPFNATSMISPLAFVVGLSMAKEALEDWNRYTQDKSVNSSNANVHEGSGVFGLRSWQEVKVGDVVRVEKDEFFPADLLFLSSSYEDGICYVETMNLDGETNLKVKKCLEVTMTLESDDVFTGFSGEIRCENPNPNLYTFVGNFDYEGKVYPIDPSQILLRDSKLRNTEYVYGVAIFTGHDSKVMQNSSKSPSKRSTIEKRMDWIIYVLFVLLLVVSFISSVGFAVRTRSDTPRWWYLVPDDIEDQYDPKQPFKAGIYHLVTALILYGYLIPISLYVSIEIVKVIQATFINQDLHMYDDETDVPAEARTSNLNEELGQVDTILSDKTGTLTCNQMDFLKCSIAGAAYGVRASEVERAAAKQMECEFDSERAERDSENQSNSISKKPAIKGFSFEDNRLMDGNWLKEHNAEFYWLFFRILAVCHTAVPELNEETNTITYEAESPDEGAFLVAAREFGFEFFKRTNASVCIREMYSSSGQSVEREYKILTLLDFTSKRKRMSVIVKDEDDRIFLFCKGADNIIFDRLSDEGRMYQEATTRHLNEYGEGGLRTLALAYKKLDEQEYASWNDEFQKAKKTVGSEREQMLESISEKMERGLTLVGATAVEDKLQQGVPQCIDKLAQSGLKLWILTGDKMETAINIGFACSLLREGMKQMRIAANNADSAKAEDKDAIVEEVRNKITNSSQMIKQERDPLAAFALIIDGKTLTYALEEDMKQNFFDLAINCASVICCRVSPKQKALVSRLVKEGTKKTTLAIGDGANDVGMIQEADIGVGISGHEGMQAVMASDFAIAQFRFLERLLLVHGHWCYKRIAQMICYFFYKNIVFGFTLFYFEAFAGFSGQSMYHDIYMLLFNVALTSLPVISLGALEQDVSSEVCLQFPALYQQGSRNLFFGWDKILVWMGNGLYCSVMVFFLTVVIFYDQPFRYDGRTADMSAVGTAMFTCIIWVVNCQIAQILNHFTWIQHILIWGSISAWYIFLLVFGMFPISGDSYRILVEVLGPAPLYWVATILVTITCNLPYLAHISFQRCFNPLDHHIIQEMKYYRKDIEDRHMWTKEKSKARQKTKIGITVRVEAKIRHIKGKIKHSPKPSSISYHDTSN